MRHNKLAGTRFLLGSRKHKPSTFTSLGNTIDCNCGVADNNNMLHSKSTYFYRWFSEHLDLVVSGLSAKKTNIASKTSYLVPAFCGAALLGVLGFIINPTAGKTEAAYASESEEKCLNGEPNSTSGQCPMELSLIMSGTNGTGAYEEAGATKLEVGKTAYRSYNFKVSATDIDKDGYKLYATAVETKLGETDLTNQLVNADYPDKEKFVPISAAEGVAGENIAAGQWGYAIAGGGTDSTLPTVDTANTNPGSLTYKAIPTNQTTPIAIGAETATTDSDIPDNPATVPDEYRLIFGAKANEGMASGHYRTQVMLSLVADPRIVATTMQQFAVSTTIAAENCARLNTPKQLKDSRDGKMYWVAKLKDGKCWMTQNLDLDIPVGGLKAIDTDIETDWITAEATKTGIDWSWNGNTNGQIESYDPGAYYINKAATSLIDCSSTKDPSKCNRYSSITSTTSLAELHYAVGNYYNWYTATAGTGSTSSGGNAAGSICPKGWKLPTSSSLSNLLSSMNSTTVRQSPYYFVPAGYVGTSGLCSAGGEGNYWSSTRHSNNRYAYFLNFASSNFNPSDYTNRTRDLGDSIRCLTPNNG